MTEQTHVSNAVIDVDITMGPGIDRDAWFHASIPLDPNSKEIVKFRASPADKEMIATTVIGLLQEWLGERITYND